MSPIKKGERGMNKRKRKRKWGGKEKMNNPPKNAEAEGCFSFREILTTVSPAISADSKTKKKINKVQF